LYRKEQKPGFFDFLKYSYIVVQGSGHLILTSIERETNPQMYLQRFHQSMVYEKDAEKYI